MTKNRKEFLDAIALEVERFAALDVVARVRARDVSIEHYHRLLISLFHQVRNGASSLALAGALCPLDKPTIKSYLLHHADEEQDHWKWILDDLASSGYSGVSPSEQLPHWTVAAYIAYNFHVASSWPLGRLAIAVMLETVAARLGGILTLELCKVLGLRREQATFFLSHSVTDKQHEVELLEVLDSAELSEREWTLLGYHAGVAGQLYRQIYESIV